MSTVQSYFPHKTNRRLFGSVGSRINFIGHSINHSQFVWLVEFFRCLNTEKCFSVCFFSPAWEMAEIVETDEERRRYCFAGFQLPEHRFSCWKSLVTTIFELVSGFLTKKGWKMFDWKTTTFKCTDCGWNTCFQLQHHQICLWIAIPSKEIT